jgi:hypothetical protein
VAYLVSLVKPAIINVEDCHNSKAGGNDDLKPNMGVRIAKYGNVPDYVVRPDKFLEMKKLTLGHIFHCWHPLGIVIMILGWSKAIFTTK